MKRPLHPRACLVMMALALLAVTPVAAADFELTPLAGFRLGGSFDAVESGVNLELDETGTYGLLLGFPLDEQSVVEVELVHQGTELSSGGLFEGEPIFDLDIDSIMAGGRYQSDHDRVRGFVAGGLGLTRFNPHGSQWDDEWSVSLSLGGGALVQMGERFALRLEGRGLGSFLIDRTAVFCGDAGCQVLIEGSGILQVEARVGLSILF